MGEINGFESTVTLMVTGVAHCPKFGVKVYEPLEALLTTAGLQVPEIPLFEIVGKRGGVVPAQIGTITLKVGVTGDATVTQVCEKQSVLKGKRIGLGAAASKLTAAFP